MNLQKSIRRILKEETERTEFERLGRAVKKMIKMLIKDIEFPENFYDFMVDITQDEKYNERILRVTTVMKKPFSEEDSINLDEIKRKFMHKIKGFFGSHFDRFSYGGTSTLEVYLRDKERDNLNPNF